jgi:hypothetical protein
MVPMMTSCLDWILSRAREDPAAAVKTMRKAQVAIA